MSHQGFALVWLGQERGGHTGERWNERRRSKGDVAGAMSGWGGVSPAAQMGCLRNRSGSPSGADQP